ncbi:hypothetical protein V2J09_010284 [Rumex salicifolius]
MADKVIESHFEAKKNLEILEERGAIALHQIVEIHMMNSTRPELDDKLIDRNLLRLQSVFYCSQEGIRCIKECEQDVVLGLCIATKYMLADNGEIHAIHKKLEESDHGCGLDCEDVDNNVKGDCDRSDCNDLATTDLDNSKGMVHDTDDDDDVKESADADKLRTKNIDVINVPEHKEDGKLASQKRCIGAYDSRQKILLVGEGDFSFSSCLADAFISASNLTATSLDSRETVVGRYSKGEGHLRNLEERGAVVIHQVDVHTMNNHPQVKQYTPFDRIIYNFPHAGGYSARECQSEYIECHRRVVSGFFTAARWMLTEKGEIHVTHKTSHPYDRWKIVELAESVGLVRSGEVEFRRYNYPGYENKKAYGWNWDATFPVGEASTFVFRTS